MGKIGMVLCGGVAKGAYEAGVLKAIAEQQLYPDAIVGISAGAINGSFAAQLIASGQFTTTNVEDIGRMWTEEVHAENLYQGFGRTDGDDLERRNLRTLFNRIGVDPLNRRYRPKIGFDSLFAFEQLIRGDFASIISHHFLRQMLEDFLQLPPIVRRPVKLSVVATDLMGHTSFNDEMDLKASYSHYRDFIWDQDLTPEVWESAFVPELSRMIEASSSFPFVFPPTRIPESGMMLFDGGLMDNAPIGRVLRLDPEVDTVLVVSAVTVVDRPEAEPNTLYGVLGRVFSMLAGRFLIQNFRKVLQQNQKIARLQPLLRRGKNGNVLRNAYNENLAMAAGYKNLEELMSRRIVKLVPIFPRPSLLGDVFEGFFDEGLRRSYVEQGYVDGIAALNRDTMVSLHPDDMPSAEELADLQRESVLEA